MTATATLAGCAFHHMGLAVKDDGPALILLGALGYAWGERVFDPLQNVNLRLCTASGRPAVEIVQPGGEGPSPIDGMISNYSAQIYHTCYETADLAATLAEMKRLGLRLVRISPPTPAILFGGRLVSFYKVQGVGIIELLEP
jgi:Glyoxalase/Bleomycin resistance protein/Dioxygenase superfamily